MRCGGPQNRGWCVLLMQLLVDAVFAGEWFPSPLTYWEGSPYGALQEEGQSEEVSRGREEEVEAEVFRWSDYEDPRTASFWREGEHVPPAPLLELIRAPSQENIERYRRWSQQKLEVSSWLAQLLAEQVSADVSWEGVQVVYFYASACSYCQKNTPVVLELLQEGVDVMPVHLDVPSPAYARSTPFAPEMGQLVALRGTPTWVLVANGHRRTVHGFSDMERLRSELAALLQEEG